MNYHLTHKLGTTSSAEISENSLSISSKTSSGSRLADEVMVVTSIEKNNLPILSLCSGIGIRVGVGSEEDVLDSTLPPHITHG